MSRVTVSRVSVRVRVKTLALSLTLMRDWEICMVGKKARGDRISRLAGSNTSVGDQHSVCLTSLARGRHCKALRQSVLNFVSLLFTRGRHCYAARATR